MLILLLVAAMASIPIGLYDHNWDWKGALEGLAILLAVVVVVIVTAWNDYAKEQEFKKLQEVYQHSQTYFVVRNGLEQEVTSDQLVIGDLLCLSGGNQVPVDVLVV